MYLICGRFLMFFTFYLLCVFMHVVAQIFLSFCHMGSRTERGSPALAASASAHEPYFSLAQEPILKQWPRSD